MIDFTEKNGCGNFLSLGSVAGICCWDLLLEAREVLPHSSFPRAADLPDRANRRHILPLTHLCHPHSLATYLQKES